MKKQFDLWVHLNPPLKKLLKELKIAIFIIALTVPTVFAATGSALEPQQTQLTGTVTDKTGEPLTGVNVLLKGTTTGVITDINGKYTISVPDLNGTLVFSFIGYTSKEEAIAGRSIVNSELAEETTILDEVVVVGYGTQLKSSVTGSITSVKSEQLQNINVTNVAAALQGVVSGAFITSQSGAPGAGSNIYLRGPVSLSGGSPLYVVDGVPMENLGYNFNMEDIESINVLKDASAAAIYGAKAAAGVILVTTKRGVKSASPSVNFNGSVGIRNVFNLPVIFTRDEYIPAKALAGYNVVDLFGPESGWKDLPDTDWFDEWYSPGEEQNYSLSMNGGAGASTYFVSANYNSIIGTQRNNWIKRYTLRVNSDHQVTKRIKFSESIYLKAGLEKPGSRLNEGLLTFRSIPMMLVYDPTAPGGYGMDPKGFQGSNNVARFESLYRRDNNYTANVSGSLDLMIIEGLHLNALFGATLDYIDSYQYQYYYDDGAFASQRNFNNQMDRNLTKIGTYTLNYNKKFGVQNISALLGYEARNRDFGYVNYANRDAYVDEPQTSAVALGIANQSGSFLRNDVLDRILSQFARVEYDYNGKYLLTGNIRRDGYGSKFGPTNRYGIFPGASIGWVVTKEDFMSQFTFINLLKIRAGYGLLGNAVGQDFAYTKYYEGGYNWDWSQTPTGVKKESGLAIVSKLPNPDIQWEEVATMNLGMDLSMLNNRLTLALDYYSRQTKKMLYNISVAPSAGVGLSVPANIGQMSNKGIEFQIVHRNQVGDFSYDVTFNGGYNKNLLISLNPDLEQLYITSGNIGTGESGSGFYGTVAPARSEPGQPLGQFYGLKTAGIYQADIAAGETRPTYSGFTPQAGDLIYVDQNGDGLINTLDYTQIGNPWPKLTYGMSLGANWKGIDVKAIFSGVLGNDIYNAFESWEYNFFSDYNTTAKIYQTSFFGTNGVTDKPRADNLARPDRNKNWGALSDFHVEKGSYLRMKNLQIGYVLPSSVLRIVKIESAKIYVSADNLFTLTKYTGMDPEIPAQAEYGGILAQGLDLTSRRYPQSRIISVGINLKF